MRYCPPVLAVLMLSATAARADQPQALFRASFEGITDGVGTAGEVIPARQPGEVSPGTVGEEAVGRAEFSQGRVGRGLLCRDGFRVAYPTAGHLRLDEGTVEMWVRPEDWHSSQETRHHVFFEFSGPHGWMSLYRYYEPGRGLFFLVNDNTKKNWQIAESPIAWEPGQWHHLAAGWSRSASVIRLHIDGKLIRELTFPVLPFPAQLPKTFTIGDAAWGSGLNHSTTIDEAIIWDRLLSPARIGLHSQGDFTTSPPLSADSVFLRTEAEGDGERWRYELRLLEEGVDPKLLKAEIGVTESAGKQMVWQQEITHGLYPGPTGGTIDLSARPTGEYTITCRLMAGVQKVAELARPIWRLDPLWRREQVNVERVLPPWIPVTAQEEGEGVRLGCWNRVYSYTGSLLPSQMISGGEALLAGPMELEAAFVGEKPVAWQVGKASGLERRDHFAAFGLTAKGDGLTCTAQARMEFDGVLFTDLALSGKRLDEIDTLSLTIPFRASQVRYVHRTDIDRGGVNTTIAAGDGVADHGTFCPYLWIGGNDRGLAFFTDTNRSWPNSLKQDAFQVVRRGDQVLLRLNVMKTGQVLPQPWKFRFGLLATPVKPLPDDWRRGRIEAAEKPSLWVVWPNEQQWRMFGHPDFKDPSAMKESFAASWKRGVRPIQYNTLHQLSSAAPEWQVYGQRWALIGGWNDTFCEMNLQAPFMAVCAPSGWGDFWAWRMAKAVRDYDYGGLYFDNCFISPCANVGHGHGPWADGVYDFQIEALRSVYRRLYGTVKDQHPDGAIVQHMSGNLNIFLQTYADYTLDGEHLAARVQERDGHYTQVLTLDEIRGEYLGRPYGVAPLLLPKMPGTIAYDPVKGPARTRELMALLLLHDIHLWAAYCHYETVTSLQKVMDRFGWLKRADFVPYFGQRCPASVAGKNVYVSVYSNSEDKAAVAVVANLRPESVKTRLTVRPAQIGLPDDAVARDAESGAALGRAAELDLVVRGLDLRLVYLSSPKAAALWEPQGVATEEIDRAERIVHGDFEKLTKFDPQAAGWPRDSVAKGWQIADEIPAGWPPHSASPPGILRVLRGKEAHFGQSALYLGESCFVGEAGFNVKPGQVYRISFWAKGGGQAFLSGTKYGTRDGKTVFLRTDPLVPADLTPEWKQYIAAFRPAPDTDNVVVLLQCATRGDHACFDDVSVRQVGEIEGRVLDAFGALRKDGSYIEPSATAPESALQRAEDELTKARQALDEALKQNPDAATQRLAARVAEEGKRLEAALKKEAREGASLCDLINQLNGLARVAHDAVAGLQFVDVRQESANLPP